MQGVIQNDEEAYFWFTLAAVLGSGKYYEARDLAEEALFPYTSTISAIKARAQKWLDDKGLSTD